MIQSQSRSSHSFTLIIFNMVKNLGTLAAASLTANQLASLARNTKYLYGMARGRKYTKKRFTASASRGGGYLTGPRYRSVRPYRPRAPPVKYDLVDNQGHDFTTGTSNDSILTSLSAGDGPSDRDGRFTRILNIRGQMVFPSGEDMRVVIYAARNPETTLALSNPEDPIDPNQFKVFYDNYWHPVGNGGNRDLAINLNFGKFGHRIEYDGTSSLSYVTSPIRLYQQKRTTTGLSTGSFICSFVDD